MHFSANHLLSLCMLLLLSCTVQATSFGVYHISSRQAASPCTAPRIPYNLCPACKMKPFKVVGAKTVKFGGVNRFDIFDIRNSACLNAIKTYVKNNKCDTLRAKALKNINSPWGYKVLAYFMYSICETCCDCIPIGAKENQYEQRKRAGTLINIYRGNCPAHYYYDTCKIWPKSSQLLFLEGKQKSYPNGQWCGDFKKWQFSNNAKGWLKNNAAKGYTSNMKRAMNMIASVGRCTHKTVWQNCVKMERAEKRI